MRNLFLAQVTKRFVQVMDKALLGGMGATDRDLSIKLLIDKERWRNLIRQNIYDLTIANLWAKRLILYIRIPA